MSKLRCLIVDDEPLARVQLRALLLEQPDAEPVGEAGTLALAREMMATLQPEVVLLDIQLRNESGFDLLAGLEPGAAVIFVTAHDQHAVRAFDTEAADYLLKPVDGARLRRALERARAGLADGSAGQSDRRRLLQLGATGEFVAIADILYIEADRHRTKVAIAGEAARTIRQSFGELTGLVPAKDFAQLDRGVMVNLARISLLRRDGDGGEATFTGDTAKLALGAIATKRLRELLERRNRGCLPHG